jgi:hypothetical protein
MAFAEERHAPANEAICSYSNKGRREKNITKVTYICRSAKKRILNIFLDFFIAFLGVSYQGEFENTPEIHKKKHRGS